MTPTEFAKRRARIDTSDKSQRWKNRAMAALVREAKAIAVANARHIIGWQMIGGQVVCMKHRYKNRETAEHYLSMIRATVWVSESQPQRSYHCTLCNGWHLTSKANIHSQE